MKSFATYALKVLPAAYILVWLEWSLSTHGVGRLILEESVVTGIATLLFTVRYLRRLRKQSAMTSATP